MLLSPQLVLRRRKPIIAAGWTGPTANLTHRWALNDTSAGLNDLVGSINGTLSGGVTLDSSGVAGGTALAFNGTTGYITLSANALPALTGAHSAFVWVKMTTLTFSDGSPQTEFAFFQDASNTARICNYSQTSEENGHVSVAIVKAGTDIGIATETGAPGIQLSAGNWVHVGYSYSGSAVTAIFINGASVTLGPNSGTPSQPSGNFLGSKNAPTNGFYKGSLYNLAIYSATADATFANSVYAAN